ncbi:MAG: hypothetical protein QM809_14035 [Gordonia sp. (in: high G+C Gram-positive bacteria)]|uniref:hypothetical protein n=1 Tax=Gordonia sp. (in: high G+C Gram-positive bacteria) TaxID=84139 RepID=UPI0039E37AFD
MYTPRVFAMDDASIPTLIDAYPVANLVPTCNYGIVIASGPVTVHTEPEWLLNQPPANRRSVVTGLRETGGDRERRLADAVEHHDRAENR